MKLAVFCSSDSWIGFIENVFGCPSVISLFPFGPLYFTSCFPIGLLLCTLSVSKDIVFIFFSCWSFLLTAECNLTEGGVDFIPYSIAINWNNKYSVNKSWMEGGEEKS